MPTALFVSPHLDDVAFSCGGLLATLSEAGWHTVLATVFTRSVVPAGHFALACQLDKGLPAEADYMALRRAEDLQAGAILSATAIHWLDLPEAPHRGYETASDLFGSVHEGDAVLADIVAGLGGVARRLRPDLVLAPQGLGRHVDHQLVVTAVQAVLPVAYVAYYRDTPYAIRDPGARSLPCVPAASESMVPIANALDRKIRASSAYATQIGFQFGSAAAVAQALTRFAEHEGGGVAAECFCGRRLDDILRPSGNADAAGWA